MSHRSTFSPRLEALEDRFVPTTVNVLNGVMTVSGTEARDVIRIEDNGSAVSVRLDDSSITTSYSGVASIKVTTGGGRDYVRYVRNGAAADRDLSVKLGTQTDTFSAYIAGTLAASLHLDIQADPSLVLTEVGQPLPADTFGNDIVSVWADDLRIAPGGLLDVDVDGGRGADTITLLFSGAVDRDLLSAGRLTFDLDGGDGGDTITARISNQMGPASMRDGFIGSVNDPATVRGGDGDDTLELIIVSPAFSPLLYAGHIDGGNGFDTATHSSNVSVTAAFALLDNTL